MSISVSLADRNNNPLHLDKLLYAADSNNNVTAVKFYRHVARQSVTSFDCADARSSDGKLNNSNNTMAALQDNGAIQPVQLSNDYSSTDGSSPSNSCKLSSTSSISKHSLSLSDMEDAKAIHAAPQALGDETAVGCPNAVPNTSEATMASRLRTRNSTGSTSKRRQTQPQAKTQTKTPKQKHQPAASKLKMSPAKFKAKKGRHKSHPPNRSFERNRIAASKCRQKKKEWLCDLETNKSKLEKQHRSLDVEYNELRDEVTQLKNFLMAHAGCNDPNVDGWINNEANIYIRRLSQNAPPQGAAATQAHQDTFKDTDSLTSPESQVSDSLLFPGNNGLLNESVLDSMFFMDQCWFR